MIEAIKKEISLRSKNYNDEIETIYYGGGTPSLLKIEDITDIFESIEKNYSLSKNLEVTIEANPDDLTKSKLKSLSKTKINRISLGIQTLNDDALKLMKRVHSSKQSIESIENSLVFFKNLSIDLIYGIPNSGLQSLDKDLRLLQYYDIKHVSTYALTVESKTLLEFQINKNLITMPSDDEIHRYYMHINSFMTNEGYINYEMNSYAKNGFYSKNNSGYWLRKKYIGIGPSAHSFDGNFRSWNISNNKKYIDHINQGLSYFKKEKLTRIDHYNEYIMTGLRTIWGISTEYIESNFNVNFKNYFLEKIQKHIVQKNVEIKDNVYLTTNSGRFLADGIASDLFLVNLK